MNKLSEAKLLSQKIIPYLESLGYPNRFIRPEVRTNQGRRADAVVYQDNDEPLIVVEVKQPDKAFPVKDEKELRYDSSVRQAYLYAKELKAPYMLLSNGEEHYWFESDAGGRPRLLSQPVVFQPSNDAKELQPDHSLLVSTLLNLWDFSKSNYLGEILVPSVLKAKIESEKKNVDVEKYWSSLMVRLFNDLPYDEQKSSLFFKETFKILDRVRLSDYSSLDLLSIFDRFLNNQKNELRINRWLADFMIQLAQIQASSKILDMSAGFGTILAAAKIAQPKLGSGATVGVSKNAVAVEWAQLQQYLLGQNSENIITGDLLEQNIELEKPTHIIFVPELGGRVQETSVDFELFHHGIKNREDLYIERAIRLLRNAPGRIVAIVPESLLFAKSREFTREYLISRTRIRAIIGLESGVLSNTAHIKSSILVLDSRSDTEPSDIFMAQIAKAPKKDTFNSRDFAEVSDVLNAFNSWTGNAFPEATGESWITKLASIELNNLSTTRYKLVDESIAAVLGYEVVPLQQVVTFIGRGKAIKLDSDGKIPVIGPAAVRALAINEDGIQETSEKFLQTTSLSVKPGDIVLNNIGVYLGEAAVIGKTMNGMYVSQHIILIRANEDVINKDYLAVALNSEYVKSQLQRRSTGSIMPSLTKANLETTLIPLPPYDIQRAIVNKVTEMKSELMRRKRTLEDLDHEFTQLIKNPFQAGGNQ